MNKSLNITLNNLPKQECQLITCTKKSNTNQLIPKKTHKMFKTEKTDVESFPNPPYSLVSSKDLDSLSMG